MKFRPLTLTLLSLISVSSFAVTAARSQSPVVPPSANAPVVPQPPQPVQPVQPVPTPTVPAVPTAPPGPQGARPIPQMPPPPPGQGNFTIPPTALTPIDLNSPGIEAKLPAKIVVSGIAAMVNGEPITYQYLVTRWLKEGATAPNFMDEMINETLIRQQAKKEGIVVTPAETTAKLMEAKKYLLQQYPGETWAQFLVLQGRSESYVRQNIYDGLLAVKLVERTMPPPSLVGKVHLYHILKLTVAVPGAAAPEGEVLAISDIQKIRDLIVSGKASFQDEARKESQDSSAAQGGDLGWVGRDAQLDPAFAKAAFALKEGEISQPVKSQYGYHLIYAAKFGADATPADIAAYKSSKAEDDRARTQIQNYLKQLRASASVTNYLLSLPPQTPIKVLGATSFGQRPAVQPQVITIPSPQPAAP